MAAPRKLIVIGFDSISLAVLEDFVSRGCLPTVGRLIREGCITQTWPCFPMETGTNWACLATGASPWVTGCNMSVHMPGDPLDRWQPGFPAHLCRAEQLWSAARGAGKRAVVFDWTQSYPFREGDDLVHVGEDGRPDNAIRALQEVRAYTTHPRQAGPHVVQIYPAPEAGTEGSLGFEIRIDPGRASRYRSVDPLHARVLKGGSGYDRVAVYASRATTTPLFTIGEGQWSDWVEHTFRADGKPTRACLRGKLLAVAPDASRVHLYLSEVYCQEDFAYPSSLVPALSEACGPFITQCSRQQVVQGGASDIATYMDEQRHLAHWWRDAAGHVLSSEPWDLFMLKWHGPDWTNHLTMYMIDPRHPMHDPGRAEEGWALWEELMGWGDEIVARAIEAAGPDPLVALVSDHGGGTHLPGLADHPDPNQILSERGWLVRGADGSVDWPNTVAFARSHYIFINLEGRDPHGTVSPGLDCDRLRDQIVDALLDWTDGSGRHRCRVVLPVETAGRLGVGGDRVGDIFIDLAPVPAGAAVDRDAFWATHDETETGTWDWPRLNAGSHLDDPYFVLCGPGVRQGYRRPRPTLITSVAPTLATGWGIPVPADADGSVLWDFFQPAS